MRHLASLSLLLFVIVGSSAQAADAAAGTCVNATCPVSGKPVDSAIPMVPFMAKGAPAGSMAGFCCPKCQATYDKDPAKCEADLVTQMNAKSKK